MSRQLDWTDEKFEADYLPLLKSGKNISEIAKVLDISRQRAHTVLKAYRSRHPQFFYLGSCRLCRAENITRGGGYDKCLNGHKVPSGDGWYE